MRTKDDNGMKLGFPPVPLFSTVPINYVRILEYKDMCLCLLRLPKRQVMQ